MEDGQCRGRQDVLCLVVGYKVCVGGEGVCAPELRSREWTDGRGAQGCLTPSWLPAYTQIVGECPEPDGSGLVL